jgi:hypothetical protein
MSSLVRIQAAHGYQLLTWKGPGNVQGKTLKWYELRLLGTTLAAFASWNDAWCALHNLAECDRPIELKRKRHERNRNDRNRRTGPR